MHLPAYAYMTLDINVRYNLPDPPIAGSVVEMERFDCALCFYFASLSTAPFFPPTVKTRSRLVSLFRFCFSVGSGWVEMGGVRENSLVKGKGKGGMGREL